MSSDPPVTTMAIDEPPAAGAVGAMTLRFTISFVPPSSSIAGRPEGPVNVASDATPPHVHVAAQSVYPA